MSIQILAALLHPTTAEDYGRLYMGALAGARIAKGHAVGRMDPDTPAQTTTVGYPFGEEDVFSSHYVFFIAAAAIELLCILLVLPTYVFCHSTTRVVLTSAAIGAGGVSVGR